jgi:multisubunit Na+/H+ antiporter MnhG subunit
VTAQGIAADVLLGLAAALVLASSAGILVMRDTYQKLHYLTPLALIAPLIVGLAVLVRSGWSENSSETWLALLFVVIGGPFLTHATIRAARIRDKGDWRPGTPPAQAAGTPPAGQGESDHGAGGRDG